MTEEEFEDKLEHAKSILDDIEQMQLDFKSECRHLSTYDNIIGGLLSGFDIGEYLEENEFISLEGLREHFDIKVETEEEDE